MRRRLLPLLVFLAAALAAAVLPAAAEVRRTPPEALRWFDTAPDGAARLSLYFLWSHRCPHCLAARPFVEGLGEQHDWITVYSLELITSPDNRAFYLALADAAGVEARSVPVIAYCGVLTVGYDRDDTTGAALLADLRDCRAHLLAGGDLAGWPADDDPPAEADVPLLGSVALDRVSLPLLTLALAAVDSFNPCAFFVLLFLMSLLVHARSRARMLLIGGTFVVVSGLVYFLFMAAWLNLFLLVGQAVWITLVAGSVAILFGVLNVKDFFWFRRGPSLSIPDAARPGLFDRMRRLLRAEHLPAMLLGTLVLALFANAYELLCTAGFPMIYTRALTLQDLPAGSYYAYLALYNLVYVIPLFVIVVLFALTLGTRKLSEREGRSLKLLSGLMMLGLGTVLVVEPALLARVETAVLLLLVAVAVTALAHRVSGRADVDAGGELPR